MTRTSVLIIVRTSVLIISK